MITGPFFVGVDGGGTGCRARIEDAAGRVLGSGIAGPAALRFGIENALGEVQNACSCRCQVNRALVVPATSR